MSSVQYLRKFVTERLTAAAEEILGVFEKAVVKYEEEIRRQRRLLDIAWKPEIKLLRIELPQQYICQEEDEVEEEEEEVLAEQQLCIQERNFSLDQEDPAPPQIKEEQEQLCSSQEGEQLVLKQETETFMLTTTYEESDHSEDQTLYVNDDLTQNTAEMEPVVNISVQSRVEPELNSDQLLVSHNSQEAQSQDQKGDKHEDLGSTTDAEPELRKRLKKSKSHSNNVCKIHLKTPKIKKSFECKTCMKDFKDKSKLNRHLRIHTGEKPYFCNTCGNSFSDLSILRRHKTIHTGVRPYSCKTCGKNFRLKSDMKVHMRTHTGEKPHNCSTCGKRYCRSRDLIKHIRIHASECTCKTWESSVGT